MCLFVAKKNNSSLVHICGVAARKSNHDHASVNALFLAKKLVVDWRDAVVDVSLSVVNDG